MHADGARGPHLAVAAPFGAEPSVERPVGVGNDVEGQMKVLPVRGETLRDCEGDDRDPGVTELIKVTRTAITCSWQGSQARCRCRISTRGRPHISAVPHGRPS